MVPILAGSESVHITVPNKKWLNIKKKCQPDFGHLDPSFGHTIAYQWSHPGHPCNL